ncbi:aspartate racemase [Pontibacillus halophilus JSM 076056 = DSM 19796]|uniref:Aspartate racemase n=1 Tax=Pontibacillus halophilus JSM 076056 = DSM 19796 TaxID=1385510 RepID=A0A0A5GP05_9BACI|nr:aspartate racemase [Pontibacillus halophilus JSM 076056 = DSM 19796]
MGILGGMGPYATVDIFKKIVTNTDARNDQEHLKIIIYNNPTIPPRILDSTTINTPLPELIESAQILERAGASFIVMPCHTAHIWYEQIKNAIKIPIYSLIHETTARIKESYRNAPNKSLLLLATQHTLYSGLYQDAFSDSEFKLIIPNAHEQELVDKTIARVKKGQLNKETVLELNDMINSFYAQGVSMLMGCCTEIPLMYPFFKTEITLLDPTLLFAKFAIQEALSTTEESEEMVLPTKLKHDNGGDRE